MRTIIIGDIHGCDQKHHELLDKVHPGAEDRLILLGDLFDRGPESWEVYQTIMKLEESYGDRFILLRGNHEDYEELKAQTADFDLDELAMAQLEIRPQKEASAESRVQAAYGDKYDFWTMIGAKCEVAEMLDKEEPRSIRERLRRKEIEKQRAERQGTPRTQKNKDRGWER